MLPVPMQPTGLLTLALSIYQKYLNTIPEEDQWWMLPLLSASVVQLVVVHDGMLLHLCIMPLQSNCAQDEDDPTY